MLADVYRLSRNFTNSTRMRLLASVGASILLSFLEIIGLIAVVPLMQLLTGSTPETSRSIRWLADLVGSEDDTVLVAVIAVAIFVVFLVKALAAVSLRWWILGFVYREEAAVSKALLTYYLRAPFALHLRRNSADLLRTLNESVSIVFSNVVVGSVTAVSEGTTCLFILLTLLLASPLPSLVFAAYFGLAGYGFVRLLRTRSAVYGQAMHDASLGIYRTGGQTLGGVKEIRVAGVDDYFLDQFARARDSYAWARRRVSFINELPKYFLEVVFITGLGVAAIALLALTGPTATLPLLSLLAAAGFRLLPSIARFLGSVNGIRVGLPALDAVVADLPRAGGVVPPKDEGSLAWTLREKITLEGVGFRYQETDQNVLAGIDLDIPAGSSIAIVGPSGAGKSTLVDLLLGLHGPTEGRILVDGRDIWDDVASWQRCVGLVPQDVYLLDDTIRANVAFGVDREQIDAGAVAAALAGAELDDVLRMLPDGLDTVVGERGARVSGGQRQRIGIARALYRSPQVLFLDEATSALDSRTESRISATVDALRGRMTLVIVAHRLSTVRECDIVVYLDRKGIAAIGSFEHVRDTNEDFAHLVELGRLDVSTSA